MSTESGLWLALFIVSVLGASIMMRVCLDISRISGGKLKFLRDANPRLAERLEEWLPFREEWIFTGHFIVLLVIMAAFHSLGIWEETVAGKMSNVRRVTIPFLTVVTSCCLIEAAGIMLTAAASVRLILFWLPVMRILCWCLFFITIPLAVFSRRLKRKRQTMVSEENTPSVEDEILSLVEGETAAETASSIPDLQEDEKRMIVGALALDEINVRRIMTPRVDVTGVEFETGMSTELFVERARRTIIESGHSRIPVYRGSIDNIIGTVYSKDLIDDQKTGKWETIIHKNPLFIPVSKNIGDLLEEFRQSKIHLAIAVDEYGGTAGVVTFEDVLEVLVGDIKDEYDIGEDNTELKEMEPGHYRCEARISVVVLNRLLGLEIPEDEDYDTLGGYVSASAGCIPQEGETVRTDLLDVTVVKADKRHLIEVDLTLVKR